MTMNIPADEAERLAAVRRYDILDTPPDGAFDRITRIAARPFDVPISIVSIVDEDRIWFKRLITSFAGNRKAVRATPNVTAEELCLSFPSLGWLQVSVIESGCSLTWTKPASRLASRELQDQGREPF